MKKRKLEAEIEVENTGELEEEWGKYMEESTENRTNNWKTFLTENYRRKIVKKFKPPKLKPEIRLYKLL